MDIKRLITGIFVFFFVLIASLIGGLVFLISVICVTLMTLWEFYRLLDNCVNRMPYKILYIFGLFYAGILVLIVSRCSSLNLFFVFSLDILTCACFSLFTIKHNLDFSQVFVKQISGLIYVGLGLSPLVIIRFGDHGLEWFFVIIGIVMAADAGAYYVGNFIGKHSLCPLISPKKTIEGALGGVLFSLIVAIVFNCYFPIFVSKISCAFFGLIVCASSQLGDLLVSRLKRIAGVKDSGNLLPGHGGFLDRVDSLLLASPVAYMFKICLEFCYV